MKYTIPKGVFDILPFNSDPEAQWKISSKWQHIETIIRNMCSRYGFQEIRTPIFEKTDLFIRSSGEGSDIVSKELYMFEDKGKRSMALRPEGTAPVIRSVLENNLHQLSPNLKLFYIGPMFRYDRPQAGRYRQLHQFGVEAIGCNKPEQDAEVIELLYETYKALGLKDLQVQINSIGDLESRSRFNTALKEFLSKHFENLSSDSQKRFYKNPLRILDSKSPEDQQILKTAPNILDYLNEDSKQHFQKVLRLLDQLKISYEINPRLVRGLDYYNNTVFEVVSKDLGAQDSIGAGGRYDELTLSLGGPPIPAVGFAAGMERILLTMMKQGYSFPSSPSCYLYILPIGSAAQDQCFQLTSDLRKKNIPTELDFSSKKIGNGLQIASKLQASFCLIMGDDEVSSQTVILKNLETRNQTSIPFDEVSSTIQKLYTSKA